MTTPDRAETKPDEKLHLVGEATVSGQLPLEVLVRQLEHSADVNDELRLLLKEERHRLMQRDLEIEQLEKHVRALEDGVKLVQEQSEARHAEIERLSSELTRTLARLRSIEQSRVWRFNQRYNAARRSFWRLRGLIARRGSTSR